MVRGSMGFNSLQGLVWPGLEKDAPVRINYLIFSGLGMGSQTLPLATY